MPPPQTCVCHHHHQLKRLARTSLSCALLRFCGAVRRCAPGLVFSAARSDPTIKTYIQHLNSTKALGVLRAWSSFSCCVARAALLLSRASYQLSVCAVHRGATAQAAAGGKGGCTQPRCAWRLPPPAPPAHRPRTVSRHVCCRVHVRKGREFILQDLGAVGVLVEKEFEPRIRKVRSPIRSAAPAVALAGTLVASAAHILLRAASPLAAERQASTTNVSALPCAHQPLAGEPRLTPRGARARVPCRR